MVPNAHDSESLFLQPSRTPIIVLALIRVLPPVELNNQATIEADKVRYERADAYLPAKLKGREAAISEFCPDQTFRVGLLLSQRACPL